MDDFSRAPSDTLAAGQQRGHLGVHIEQGVPLLDRELNLLPSSTRTRTRSPAPSR
jgi:hypothetical protein